MRPAIDRRTAAVVEIGLETNDGDADQPGVAIPAGPSVSRVGTGAGGPAIYGSQEREGTGVRCSVHPSPMTAPGCRLSQHATRLRAKCRGFNPHKIGEPAPTECCQCGEPFVELVAGVDVNEVPRG